MRVLLLEPRGPRKLIPFLYFVLPSFLPNCTQRGFHEKTREITRLSFIHNVVIVVCESLGDVDAREEAKLFRGQSCIAYVKPLPSFRACGLLEIYTARQVYFLNAKSCQTNSTRIKFRNWIIAADINRNNFALSTTQRYSALCI